MNKSLSIEYSLGLGNTSKNILLIDSHNPNEFKKNMPLFKR